MMDPDIHVTGYIPVLPETVWQVFSDLARWNRLDPASSPRLPLDEGNWRPGFRVRVRLHPGRFPHFSRVFTMEGVHPGRMMTWAAWAIPWLIGIVAEYRFIPMGQGTRYTFNLMRRGLLGRLALPLLRKSQYEEFVRLGDNLAREATAEAAQSGLAVLGTRPRPAWSLSTGTSSSVPSPGTPEAPYSS